MKTINFYKKEKLVFSVYAEKIEDVEKVLFYIFKDILKI